MKIQSLPRFSAAELGNQAAANKVNQAMVAIELAINTMNWENFKGQRIRLQVRNGVPVVLPVAADWLVFLGVQAPGQTIDSPIQSWRAVNGGVEVTVTWRSMTVLSADVDIFAGVA